MALGERIPPPMGYSQTPKKVKKGIFHPNGASNWKMSLSKSCREFNLLLGRWLLIWAISYGVVAIGKKVKRINFIKSIKFFLEPDGNPDQFQNVIVCSLEYVWYFLKISAKSV